jgi:hypothetical protein
MRVQTLVVAAQTWGLTPAQLAAEYDLPVTQIEEALAFSAAHQGEIDAGYWQQTQRGGSAWHHGCTWMLMAPMKAPGTALVARGYDVTRTLETWMARVRQILSNC